MKWQNIPVAFPLFKHFIKLEIEPKNKKERFLKIGYHEQE